MNPYAGGVVCRLYLSRDSSRSEMSPAPDRATGGEEFAGIFGKSCIILQVISTTIFTNTSNKYKSHFNNKYVVWKLKNLKKFRYVYETRLLTVWNLTSRFDFVFRIFFIFVFTVNFPRRFSDVILYLCISFEADMKLKY